MRLGFLGSGRVGGALATRLAGLGHQVTLAARDAGPDGAARARAPALPAAPARDVVAGADVVFLATPFEANQEVLAAVAPALAGKILVDCTNPVGPGLSHGLGGAQSGAAWVAAHAPGARVVKAFSVYGYENLEDTRYPGYDVRPAMPICGDDPAAKQTVAALADALGFEPVDVGGLAQALHLEHLTLLWVRLVRAGGHPPGLVWAALRR